MSPLPARPVPFDAGITKALVLADRTRALAVEEGERLAQVLLSRGVETDFFPDGRQAASEGLPGGSDLLVVLGGDGSVLSAARALAESPVPILGVNFGRVGFLAPVPAEDAQRGLLDVLEGRAMIEPRMRLSVECGSLRAVVLNDLVVSRSPGTAMVRLALEADGARVCEYRADGLIVATPSGSTAYSLAAGGPVLAPSMQGMVVTPISAHALSHRPLVMRPDSHLALRLLGEGEETAEIVADGVSLGALSLSEALRIERHPEPYPLLAPVGLDPWRRLRDRLGWRASFDGA